MGDTAPTHGSNPATDELSDVGFIGLGNIGLPMVERLVESGFKVSVVDVNPARVAAGEQAGAVPAERPSDLGSSTIVCVCVVDDAQVREVVTGPHGVLDSCSPGTTIVLHSTIFPSTVEEMAAAARERDVAVLDAPISGGEHAARAGSLAVMVGGDAEAVDRAEPVLRSLGTLFHVGGLSSGLAVKYANQLMTFANQTAALEAVELAAAFGVDEQQVIKVAMAGTADSWCLRNWGFFDQVARSYDQGGTPAANRPWRKDLWEVVTVARDMDLSLPLAGLVSQVAAPRIHARSQGT